MTDSKLKRKKSIVASLHGSLKRGFTNEIGSKKVRSIIGRF